MEVNVEPQVHWRTISQSEKGLLPVVLDHPEGNVVPDPNDSSLNPKYISTTLTHITQRSPRFSTESSSLDIFQEGSVLLSRNRELKISGTVKIQKGVFIKSFQPIDSIEIEFCVDNKSVGMTKTNRFGEFTFSFKPAEKLDRTYAIHVLKIGLLKRQFK